MKKILPFIAGVVILTACGNKKEAATPNVILLPDTFKLHNNSVLTDKDGNQVPYVVVPDTVKPAKEKIVAVPEKKSTAAKTNTQSSPAATTQTAETTPHTPAKKKGWSNSAKGAAIGAGSGAAAGAVIAGKGDRGKGAVIGGVVGAAGGFIIGKVKDKKEENAEKDQ